MRGEQPPPHPWHLGHHFGHRTAAPSSPSWSPTIVPLAPHVGPAPFPERTRPSLSGARIPAFTTPREGRHTYSVNSSKGA
jgi:hypothetical protein